MREFRNWAEVCEEKGMLEKTLVEAGYREVDEQTEIYLIFTDEDEEE